MLRRVGGKESAEHGYTGGVKIIGFIVSLALFIGGIYLMGEAFNFAGIESLVFIAGILVTTIGCALPIHLFKRIDA